MSYSSWYYIKTLKMVALFYFILLVSAFSCWASDCLLFIAMWPRYIWQPRQPYRIIWSTKPPYNIGSHNLNDNTLKCQSNECYHDRAITIAGSRLLVKWASNIWQALQLRWISSAGNPIIMSGGIWDQTVQNRLALFISLSGFWFLCLPPTWGDMSSFSIGHVAFCHHWSNGSYVWLVLQGGRIICRTPYHSLWY